MSAHVETSPDDMDKSARLAAPVTQKTDTTLSALSASGTASTTSPSMASDRSIYDGQPARTYAKSPTLSTDAASISGAPAGDAARAGVPKGLERTATVGKLLQSSFGLAHPISDESYSLSSASSSILSAPFESDVATESGSSGSTKVPSPRTSFQYDGAFQCHDCDEIFYSEADCYEHAYPDGAFVGGHTWIRVMSIRRPGLHVIRWGGPDNDSYLTTGVHAVTVSRKNVVFMSTRGSVVSRSWNRFVGSDPVYLQMYNAEDRLPHKEVVTRAKAAIGKNGYHVVCMNSEHFASWACLGSMRSKELWGLGAMAGTASFSVQATTLALAGPLAWLAVHGVFAAGKLAAVSLLAKDRAALHWDDLSQKFGSLKCCLCGKRGKLCAPEDREACSSFFGSQAPSDSEPEVEHVKLYNICRANHASCMECLVGFRKKALLCRREDCFELFEGPQKALPKSLAALY